MNPSSSALFLLVPFVSVYLIFQRVSSQSARRSSQNDSPPMYSRSIASVFVSLSLGLLSIVIGSLGLAACFDKTHRSALNTGKEVVVTVIQFELGAAVLFILAEVVAPGIVSPKKILLYNATLFAFIDISTILTLLSIFLSPMSLPFVAPFVLTLLSNISPLPLLAIILHSQPTRLNKKATRFWVILAIAQLFSMLHSIFEYLAVSAPAALVDAYQVVQSVFMILWAISIMIIFHLLPSPNPEFNRTSLHPRITPSPSPSHASRGTGSPDVSDFLNLRDPFASPPVSPTSEKFSFSPFGSQQSSLGIFRPKRSKLSISSGAQTLFGSPPPSATSMTFGNLKNMVGPLEDAEFDPEEALLSQILLQNLDSQVNLPLERRVSEAELAGLGLGLGFGQDAEDKSRANRDNLVIVTCERRGSESTLASGSISDVICDSPNSQMTAFSSSPQRKTTTQKSSSPMKPSALTSRTAQEYLQLGVKHYDADRLEESATCFEKSATEDEGCCLGMVMWGLSLRHGWGCEKDTAEGFKWLKEAAESAVTDLESNKTSGSEVNGVQDSSFASAVSTYGLSEDLVTAIYDIGQCFFQGEGVRKDVKMSLFYYTIAARAGAASLSSYEAPNSPTKPSARGRERDLPPLPILLETPLTMRPLSTVFDQEHLLISPMSRYEPLQNNESEVESPGLDDDSGDVDTPRASTPASRIS